MQVLLTPLHYWSQLDQETMALHLAVGQALAYAMGGNAPRSPVIMALRARLHLVGMRLNDAITLGCSQEGKPGDVTELEMTVRFCELTDLERSTILRELNLVEAGDVQLEDGVRWAFAFQRARKRNRSGDLYAAIMARTVRR